MVARTTAPHGETKPLVEYLGRPKLELILADVSAVLEGAVHSGCALADGVRCPARDGLGARPGSPLHRMVFGRAVRTSHAAMTIKKGGARNPVCMVEWTRF
jgi:hypothetical protein